MASEADSIEVDSGYKSIAASWFGDIGPEDKVKERKRPKENKLEHPVKKKKKHRHKSSEETNIESKVDDSDDVIKTPALEPVLPKQPAQTLTTFLDEKLSKKLKKSKWKAQQKLKDQQIQDEKTAELDDSEDSKVTAVAKMKKSPGADITQPHTLDSLKRRLDDPALSHSTKRRLKKRLNKILKEGEADPSSSITGERTDSKPGLSKSDKNSDNIRLKEESVKSQSNDGTAGSKEKNRKTGGGESTLAEDEHSDGEEDGEVTALSENGENPAAKRKRKKKRSKQKNIKKDHRPDHLKPPHLRTSQTNVTADDKSSS